MLGPVDPRGGGSPTRRLAALVFASLVLSGCGGQRQPNAELEGCAQTVEVAAERVQELTAAIAATRPDPEASEPPPSGDVELPATLRVTSEATGNRAAMGGVDAAIADATNACDGASEAYGRIADTLRQQIEAGAPTIEDLTPVEYGALTFTILTVEEFDIAVAAAEVPPRRALPEGFPPQFPVHEAMQRGPREDPGQEGQGTWHAPPGSFQQLVDFYQDRLQRGGIGGWQVTASRTLVSADVEADPSGNRRFGDVEKDFDGFGYRGTITIEATAIDQEVTVRVTLTESEARSVEGEQRGEDHHHRGRPQAEDG